jgi:GNAT superfamily N-acetyltransferase
MPEPAPGTIDVRPYTDADGPFLARIAHRLLPPHTVSPRDRDVMARYFDELATGRLLSEPDAEAFVAMLDGALAGVIAVHPGADSFTGHPRAHVEVLVVAPEAEGRGVGRALLARVERWARDHDCREVVLDVFAGNEAATAFYERCGYQPDHIRMAKPLP